MQTAGVHTAVTATQPQHASETIAVSGKKRKHPRDTEGLEQGHTMMDIDSVDEHDAAAIMTGDDSSAAKDVDDEELGGIPPAAKRQRVSEPHASAAGPASAAAGKWSGGTGGRATASARLATSGIAAARPAAIERDAAAAAGDGDDDSNSDVRIGTGKMGDLARGHRGDDDDGEEEEGSHTNSDDDGEGYATDEGSDEDDAHASAWARGGGSAMHADGDVEVSTSCGARRACGTALAGRLCLCGVRACALDRKAGCACPAHCGRDAVTTLPRAATHALLVGPPRICVAPVVHAADVNAGRSGSPRRPSQALSHTGVAQGCGR